MSALLDSNPAYRAVKVVRVDWDTYRDNDIVKDLKIPRRSTLVMFNQGREVGRVVAQTDSGSIEALFKKAV